eukprot:3274474-Rhodomonas_salina.1
MQRLKQMLLYPRLIWAFYLLGTLLPFLPDPSCPSHLNHLNYTDSFDYRCPTRASYEPSHLLGTLPPPDSVSSYGSATQCPVLRQSGWYQTPTAMGS